MAEEQREVITTDAWNILKGFAVSRAQFFELFSAFLSQQRIRIAKNHLLLSEIIWISPMRFKLAHNRPFVGSAVKIVNIRCLYQTQLQWFLQLLLHVISIQPRSFQCLENEFYSPSLAKSFYYINEAFAVLNQNI